MATIRGPRATDAEALARLLTQLGYPADSAQLPERLAALANDANAVVFVAEHEGSVAGLATGHVIRSMHKSEPVAMLTVLVVAEGMRGLGTGRALVRRVEEWAVARGASAISLTSATRRSEAHAFYAALGYEQTGVRLARTLAPNEPR
jgi:GNAT superfamily N-acetyltransferase